MLSQQSLTDDNQRAVSPVIGVILVIGFVVLVGIGLFVFAQGLITGSEDPRIDADFTMDIEDTETWNLVYSNGDDFDSTNTDRLFIIGTNSTDEDIGEITLYEDGEVKEFEDEHALIEGMTALSSERAEDSEELEEEIGPGTSLRIVWEPADRDDVQIVVDEVVLPDIETIRSQIEQEGSISFGGGEVEFDGCDPREENCE